MQIPCEVLDGCISHTDIQILIVMMINADNTCDQCALDSLNTLERQFFMKHMYEIHVQYQSLQKLDPQLQQTAVLRRPAINRTRRQNDIKIV